MDLTGLRLTLDATGMKSGAADAQQSLQVVAQAAMQAGAAVETVNRKLKLDPSGVKDGATEVGDALKSIGPSARTTIPALNAVESSFASVERAAMSLTSILGALGIAFSFHDLVETMRGFQQVETTLIAVTGSAGAAGLQMDFLRGEVARLGLPLLSTAQNYSAFLASIKNTPLEGAKAQQVFTGMSEALTALHAPIDRQNRAWLAIWEIASQGQVTLQHLTRQLSSDIPGALGLMAQGLGVSTIKLREMISAGELQASVALPAMAKAMHEQYGAAALAAADMTQGLTNKLQTAFTEMKEIIINSGFEEGFSAMMKDIIGILNSDDMKKAATNIGIELGEALKTAGTAAKFLADNMQLIKQAIVTIFALKVTQTILEWAPAIGTAVSAIGGFELSLGRVAALLLGIRGGLLGLAAAALAMELSAANDERNTIKATQLGIEQSNKDFLLHQQEALARAAQPLQTGTLRSVTTPAIAARPTVDNKDGTFTLGTSGMPAVTRFISTLDNPDDPNSPGKKAVKAAESVRKAFQGMWDSLQKDSDDAVQKIVDKYDVMSQKIGALIKKAPQFSSEAAALEVKIQADKNHDIEALLTKDEAPLKKAMTSPVQAVIDKWDELIAKYKEIAKTVPELWQRAMNDVIAATKEKNKEVLAAEEKLQADIQKTLAAISSKQKDQALTNVLKVGSGSITVGKEAPAIKEATTGIDLLMTSLNAVKTGFDGFFQGIILGTRSAADSFKGMADSIIAALLQVIAKMLIVELIGIAIGFFTGQSKTSVGSGTNIYSSSSVGIGNEVTGLGLGSGNAGGVFKHAMGGVMSASGSMPLRRYAGGGVAGANNPQFAMFGEGSTPEAYVPLPDGRSIPVTMNGGGEAPKVTVQVINRGAPADAKVGSQRWNPALREMVVEIFLDDQTSNGPIRQSQGAK